jgi:hypothetical protein
VGFRSRELERVARAAVLVIVVVLCAVACGRTRSGSNVAVSSGAPAAHVPVAAMSGSASAHGPAPSAGAEAPPSEPTVDYASLEQARDAIERLMRRSIGLHNSSITAHRDTVTFDYWYAKGSARGWVFRIAVTDTSVCPIEAIEDAVQNAGWAQAYGYQADGPDGGEMGFVTRKFLCLIQGQWDGGDDSDTTYVPAPGCTVSATIVPRRVDDVMR